MLILSSNISCAICPKLHHKQKRNYPKMGLNGLSEFRKKNALQLITKRHAGAFGCMLSLFSVNKESINNNHT